MPTYTPPLRDMHFVLHELLGVVEHLRPLPAHAELDVDTVNAVLEEAGRFAADVVQPLNAVGDAQGCTLNRTDHSVTTPAGFAAAYAQYVAGGWPALAADPAHGGQGLPHTLNLCLCEMLNSASQAWAMYPGLSHGAYECLHAHGTPEQQATYLPPLAQGTWTGTMCLTEPHCGTDLGLLRTRAEPQADGTYRLTGEKIFISAGEHDLADNIVHLVLARLPDAPAGTRGISLFVVPKWCPTAEGGLGARNAIRCTALEHKMGIHGNATCQMVLDGAVGTLVGEPHRGLAAMFVMMNGARLFVGNQSLGLTEVAYQNAVAYARERQQMRAPGGAQCPQQPADPILVHPDVRKMLLTARAYAEGGRALMLYAGLRQDVSLSHPDAEERQAALDELALLTPIVKAFLTDNGWLATSQCVQVFGGHGYIREWGMEQFLRDARINMIYEGTNTIQSLDLLGRKVLGDGGRKLQSLGRQISAFIDTHGVREDLQDFITPLAQLTRQVTQLTTEIGLKSVGQPAWVGAVAVDYLRVVGHLVFAYLFARMAQVALDAQRAQAERGQPADPFYAAKLHTARFYVTRLLPETAGLIRSAHSGAAPLMAMDAALF